MNNDFTPNRWFNVWRPQARPAALDPADLGTAYGLEASFEEAHVAAQDRAPPAKPGWMQRLRSRGRRAA